MESAIIRAVPAELCACGQFEPVALISAGMVTSLPGHLPLPAVAGYYDGSHANCFSVGAARGFYAW
jgi:hypothetical protein